MLKNQFIIPVPAQMRTPEETWYQGTADAIYQNINLIEQADPHVVAIFGADHIYRMNVTNMIEFHEVKRAHVTVAAIPVPRSQASEFGVIEAAPDGRIIGFHEKSQNPPTIPGDPSRCYASMGNYVFSTRSLLRELYDDAANPASSHDFGRDILPSLVGRAEIFAYDFQTNKIPGEPDGASAYWRDVGTIDAYYEANIDLRAVSPALNLYNREWPLRTVSYPDAPAKFTFDDEDRRGQAIDTVVSSACILSGGTVRNSVLVPGRSRALRRAGRRFGDSRQLRHRAARQSPARDSRQERPHSRRRGDRLRPGERPPLPSRHRERHRSGRRQPVFGGCVDAVCLANP